MLQMWDALGGLCTEIGYGGGEHIFWAVGEQRGRRGILSLLSPHPPALGSPGARAVSPQSGDTQGWG